MVSNAPKSPKTRAGKGLTDDTQKGFEAGCPLDVVLKILSGQWTTHVIWVLGRNGPTRHGQLRRLIEGVSPKVLTQRLRKLEGAGVVYRDYKPTVPPEVTYGLTERGLELDSAIRNLEPIAEHWT